MNQVPEIKEGLQFTDTQENEQTVYTVDHLISLERGVHVTWNGADIGAWYPFHAVDKYFQEGTWKVIEKPNPNLSTLFSSQPHNVVMTALEECAKDYQNEREDLECEEGWALAGALDNYLANCPTTSLVTELVDKIHQLGFTIIPK